MYLRLSCLPLFIFQQQFFIFSEAKEYVIRFRLDKFLESVFEMYISNILFLVLEFIFLLHSFSLCYYSSTNFQSALLHPTSRIQLGIYRTLCGPPGPCHQGYGGGYEGEIIIYKLMYIHLYMYIKLYIYIVVSNIHMCLYIFMYKHN